MALPVRMILCTSCVSTLVTFFAGRAVTILGTFIPTELTGKPVSSWPLAAAPFAESARPISSDVAALSSVYLRLPMSAHAPLSGCRPFVHSEHSVGESHSVQPSGQVSHRPVAVEPYFPLPQKDVQLLPPADAADASRRNGLLPPAKHAVHACESPGTEQVVQPYQQGAQCRVAFGAKPVGHAARHWPRWKIDAVALAGHAVTAADPTATAV